MAEDTGGEKSLPPSARKIERAREKGNVSKSQDLSSAWTLMFALLGMYFFGRGIFSGLASAMRFYFGEAGNFSVEPDTLQELALKAVSHTAGYLLPFMLLLMVAGVMVNLFQVGFLFSPSAIAPSFAKLNPLTGLKKFVSVRSLVELVKSIAKLAIIGSIVYFTFRSRWSQIFLYSHLTPIALVGAVGSMISAVWIRVVIAMLIMGILDFGFQRWQYLREMRMTSHEAKEESKDIEGDPRVKQQIRRVQRQLAMQRMMGEVPEADVVITNPTTYAVALRYDMLEMAAPTVVAKGARLLAERIREVAVDNDVPIVEKPELARTLFRTIEVGHPVPEQLFLAVAEVLAFVYEIDQREKKIRERAETAQQPVLAGMAS
jgi:flagellar biosynthesis protein FlhB